MPISAVIRKINEKKVNKKDLVIAILIFVIAALIFFGWYYFRTKQTPIDLDFTPHRNHEYLFSIYEPGVMSRPLGVAVSDLGDIYITDSVKHRIAVFDANGAFVRTLGKSGKGPGEFNYPTGVAAYGQKIYVADFYNQRVQILNSSGEMLRSLPRGEDARKIGGKIMPATLTVDKLGNIYVSDVSQHRILVFDNDGKFVRAFGRGGSNPGEVSYVNGIGVNVDDGEIYVANSNNARVDVFDMHGKYLGQKLKNLANPKGMAFEESSGNLFIVDTLAHKVNVMDNKGNVVESIGQRGLDAGQFNFPTAVTVDKNGRVYVADRENDRIQVFGK